MYVFGGVVESGDFRTNDLCAMNVDVPTLQELAVETAVRTLPGLKASYGKQLNALHIPTLLQKKFLAH